MNFDHLETPLDEAPLFFVEPRDRDNLTELARVRRFRAMFRKAFPKSRLVAVPNGGKRGQGAINQARAEGAAWGFPDLIALGDGQVAFLEFKSGTGTMKPHQVDWGNWLDRSQFFVGTFRKPETAIDWLARQGFQ